MSAAICVTLKPEATIYTITANGQELQGFTLESQWEGFKKLRRGDSVVILVEKNRSLLFRAWVRPGVMPWALPLTMRNTWPSWLARTCWVW